jgi:hypothetical protein
MIKSIALSIFLLIAVSSVVSASEHWTVLLDLSGSMGDKEDSPLAKNIAELKRIIQIVPKAGRLDVLAIGKHSDVELLKLIMPRQAGGMNVNLINARNAALKKLDQNIKERAGSIDKSGTDLLGALLKVSRIFSEDNEATSRKVFMLSDMLDTTNMGLKLSALRRPESHKAFLANLTKKQPRPDLKSADIYCYSIFSDTQKLSTPEVESAIQELKKLWISYLASINAKVVDYKTSY